MKGVLFCADGGEEAGAGHLMRCLGLARHLVKRGLSCRLATWGDAGDALAQWRRAGIPIHITPRRSSRKQGEITARLAFSLDARWVVADGYGFGLPFQEAVKEAGLKLLLFDDMAREPLTADVVVNPNAGAEEEAIYRCPGSTILLLGCKYAMVREEFIHASPRTRKGPFRILVTFGCGRTDHLVRAAIEGLNLIRVPFTGTVICGDKAGALAHGARRKDDRWTILGPTSRMADIMANADLALCAGGSTTLELAYMGVPMVIVTLSENQIRGTRALAGKGGALWAGNRREGIGQAPRLMEALLKSPGRLKTMSRVGRALVDGQGPERVGAWLEHFHGTWDLKGPDIHEEVYSCPGQI